MNLAEFLRANQVEFDLIPHHRTYAAQRLAEDLHVSGRDVAKTVLLRSGTGEHLVAVLPASESIDLKKAARAVGAEKLELATEVEILEHCPDCELGALPPFGSLYDLQTVVDDDLTQDEEIYFEGNTHHEAIRMRFDDFRRLEKPKIVSLTA